MNNFYNIKESFANQIYIQSSSFFIIEAYRFKEKQLLFKNFLNHLKLIEKLQGDDDIAFPVSSYKTVLFNEIF